MKTALFTAVATALLSPAPSQLHAGERLNLESAIYVFRQGAFHEIDVSNAVVAADGRTFVLRSPASMKFDQLTLSLKDARVAWGGGSPAPEQFSLMASPPTVPIALGTPVTLASSAGLQYLERTADNRLQVREIRSDSPEAPHVRLSFTASKDGDSAEDLQLACDLDIATVNAREKIPGVALEVGKPKVTSLKEKETVRLRLGQRAAILLKAPNGSDYSMLLILRLAYAQGQGAAPSNGGERPQDADARAGAGASERPVVPVVDIDGKQYAVVGFRDRYPLRSPASDVVTGPDHDPLAVVEGKTVEASPSKVSLIPGNAFAKGFVTVVDNVFRAYEHRPDSLITTEDGYTNGPRGSDSASRYGYTNFSGSLTADRDLPDVTVILLSYEDLGRNDTAIPKVWILGTSVGRLEAAKTHAFNEYFPLVVHSQHPIRWTTLVFSGGVQIPSTGGNQMVDALLDRIDARNSSR